MKEFSIYLAGNIQKNHESESQIFWTDSDREQLNSNLKGISLNFLNPAIREDDLSDQTSVFGRDMTQVFLADLVLVDARERRGLGVGAEMMWAKVHAIPVICLAPSNTHYHRSEVELLGVQVQDWVHPFVATISDLVAKNLDEVSDWIKDYLAGKSPTIKDIGFIKKTMQYYRSKGHNKDVPMHNLFHESKVLEKRFASIT